MREIKFRAWFNYEGSHQSMLYVGDEHGTTHPLDCVKYKMDGQDVILMQYTGLKDGKQNKEIYESDKLSFVVFDCFGNDTQHEGYVVYSGSRFMLWNKIDDEFYGSDGGFDLDWIVSQDDECEVIGNVHEKL